MILPSDRKLAHRLVKMKLWKVGRQDLFGTPMIIAPWGMGWLLDWMRKRQTSDGLHHAPRCPGNEWSGANLVFLGCNCGAARMARQSAPTPTATPADAVEGDRDA